MKELEINVQDCVGRGHKEYRIILILSLLLQNSEYISLNHIADVIEVSRNTIINDIEDVKKMLNQYHLKLESKVHYGIKVVGLEKDIRKMFSYISGKIAEHQSVNTEFFEYQRTLKFDEETQEFVSLLNKYNIIISYNAIESILFHIKVMLFRLEQVNIINEITIHHHLIDDNINKLVHEFVKYLENKHNMHIPKVEEGLLASQIFGKASLLQSSQNQKETIGKEIEIILKIIDQEYATKFALDSLLIENMMFHILPLLMRVSYGLTLSDSLVGSISAQYMNAFLIAMRFVDYHSLLREYKLSRYEIGYLALHFATSIERSNQKKLQEIKRIVLVSEQMRSSSKLLVTKIQGIFPLANIVLIPYTSIQKYSLEDIDMVISTIDFDCNKKEDKFVLISHQFNDRDIRKIKSKVLMCDYRTSSSTYSLDILFKEELFELQNGEAYYLELIEHMAKKMIFLGYAKEGFEKSVLERESRFSTVYQNGINAPHSLTQMAIVDSIGVIILKHPIYYKEKKIQLIFLINIQKGHLLVHQEIGDFIVKLMDNNGVLSLLSQVTSYGEFMKLISEYL